MTFGGASFPSAIRGCAAISICQHPEREGGKEGREGGRGDDVGGSGVAFVAE